MKCTAPSAVAWSTGWLRYQIYKRRQKQKYNLCNANDRQNVNGNVWNRREEVIALKLTPRMTMFVVCSSDVSRVSCRPHLHTRFSNSISITSWCRNVRLVPQHPTWRNAVDVVTGHRISDCSIQKPQNHADPVAMAASKQIGLPGNGAHWMGLFKLEHLWQHLFTKLDQSWVFPACWLANFSGVRWWEWDMT